jgi:hypothetical protein
MFRLGRWVSFALSVFRDSSCLWGSTHNFKLGEQSRLLRSLAECWWIFSGLCPADTLCIMRTLIAELCKRTGGMMQGNWPELGPRLQAVHLGRAGSFSVVCVTHIFMRHTSKGLLFLCWGCFLVNTFSHTLCLGLLSPCKLSLNGKNKAVRILCHRQLYENGTLRSAP